MAEDPGFRIIRFGDLRWEPRTEDDWPCLVKRHLFDEARDITVRIVWYARGAVEPRHVHGGTHAAVILMGQAEVDGRVLGPWDAVYGPAGVPHGPLYYPMGCMLFVTLRGGALHRAVGQEETIAGAPAPSGPGVLESEHPWIRPEGHPDGWRCERKLLFEDRARDYTALLARWPAGAVEPLHQHPGTHAALILTGRAIVDGVELGPWDMIYGPGGVPHGPLRFPDPCTMAMSFVGGYAHHEVEGSV